MRHLHKIRLYFIECLSCSGTSYDQYIVIQLRLPGIQTHFHMLTQDPVISGISIRKYLVYLFHIRKLRCTELLSRHKIPLAGIIHDDDQCI